MAPAVDLSTTVGTVELTSCILTASGTAGYGTELSGYGDLSALGAVVTKSLSVGPWPGNPAPRVTEVRSGMLNSVGLQGPGIAAWIEEYLGALVAEGVTVVASIWGRTVGEYAEAARLLDGLGLAAIELNVSCPNVEDRSSMFAHSAEATAAVVEATTIATPRWLKLSPNVANLVEIARAGVEAGADALVLTNTLLGMALDPRTGHPVLGAGGGGLSGPAVHPVAVRAVYECRAALPEVPIVGVGGVCSGSDAIELLSAGAQAVEVGTATFADPRAPWKIAAEVARLLEDQGVSEVAQVIGRAHQLP